MRGYRTNPDIDEYLGLSGLDDSACDSVKAACLSQFPDDGGPSNSPANRGLDACLQRAGYYDRTNPCFYFRSYDNPGATTYPLDVTTNPDNPDYIWDKPLTWALIAGAGLLVFVAIQGRR